MEVILSHHHWPDNSHHDFNSEIDPALHGSKVSSDTSAPEFQALKD